MEKATQNERAGKENAIPARSFSFKNSQNMHCINWLNVTPTLTQNYATHVPLVKAEHGGKLGLLVSACRVQSANFKDLLLGEFGFTMSRPLGINATSLLYHVCNVVSLGTFPQVPPVETVGNVAGVEALVRRPAVEVKKERESMGKNKLSSFWDSESSVAFFRFAVWPQKTLIGFMRKALRANPLVEVLIRKFSISHACMFISVQCICQGA